MISIGSSIPSGLLLDDADETVDFSNYLGKAIVIYVYHKYDTPG